jgi:hypothetical protein
MQREEQKSTSKRHACHAYKVVLILIDRLYVVCMYVSFALHCNKREKACMPLIICWIEIAELSEYILSYTICSQRPGNKNTCTHGTYYNGSVISGRIAPLRIFLTPFHASRCGYSFEQHQAYLSFRWSPIQVLSRSNIAWLRWSNSWQARYVYHGMLPFPVFFISL